MYVIFPADEIVYLSYGRVLYVPPYPTSENQVATLPPQPLRSSLSTESHASHLSCPSTSTNSSTKSHVSGTSCFRTNGLDTSSYPPSPGDQTCTDNRADPPVRPKRKKESLFRFTSLLQSKSKVPEIERKSSFSDFFKIGRDKRNTSPAIVAPSQIQNPDQRFTRDQTAVTFQLAETKLQRNSRENTPKEQRKETGLRTKPTNCTPPNKSPNLVVRNTENKTVFDFSQPSTSKSYLDPLSHKINSLNSSPDNTSNKSADLTTPKTPNTKPKRKISSEKSPPIRTRSEKSPQKTIQYKVSSDKTSYRVRSRSCNSDKSSLSKSFSEKVSCVDKSPENLREKTPPTNSSREKSPPGRIFSDRKQLSNSLYQKPTTKSLKKTRLNKSFRDKLTVGKDKTPSPQIGQSTRNISGPVNFDSLFAREPSPAKLSLIIPPRLETEAGSRTSFRQAQEKQTPTRERTSSVKAKAKKSILKPQAIMAANESALRDLLHPGYNEQLKSHNAVTFKLVRTVSDFTQQLGQMYEQHAEELQLLVSNFRKKNGELRKERPACPSSLFHTWETLLQEVEIDSQALGEIASILGRQVSRPLLERSFHRKIQSRKVFSHRESYETIISKTEEKLAKCRQEYKTAYLSYLAAPSTESLSCYFKTHNSYVQQLHATNGMLEEYGKDTLPNLLQELEEIYSDICSTITDSVLQGAEVVSARAMEQCKRYEGLVTQCKSVAGGSDLFHLARSLPVPPGRGLIMKRPFVPPQPPPPVENVDGEINETPNENVPPPLKDELVVDRLSAVQLKPSHDALRKEAGDLETQIRQIHDALDTLVRMQQRSVEASLYNKANEIQEDISLKRFDLRVAKIHLSAIHAQKELFSSKLEGDVVRERKLSTASTASMKNKWLKAFKSLKTPPPETEKKNGAAATRELLKGDPDAHNFQENTYKKITPCDVCSQILRGHTRQGLKCRICKINVHLDCQNKASKCQTKARLLRRQKSTSEIDTRVPDTTLEEEKSPEVDQIYQVLKQATEISNSKPRVTVDTVVPPGITVDKGTTGSATGSSGSSGQSLNRRGAPPVQPARPTGSNLAVVNPAPCSTSSAPHSPRRQKLNLRMKSLSLDSPESTEHVQRRRHHGVTTVSDPHSNQSSSSRIQFIIPPRSINSTLPFDEKPKSINIPSRSINITIPFEDKPKSTPSSPVHNRRLLSAKNIRMSSVELPDDNDKSLSSASTSPCPSPVSGKKSHRLLPTNLYVVLYNFKSRHQDELDLKAGYKVTVIDTSDSDWWKGKCLGRVGFFPSKYVSKLSSGEKPLQVTHNLQVSDGDNGLMLLRDQIVIQIGEEVDGMVMIRSGDNRQGVCPLKFLQEV